MNASASQPFDAVAIIGCGLIGTSIGLAIRERRAAVTVIGIDLPGGTSTQTALQRGAIDRVATLDAISSCDLIILATPVRQILALLPALRPHLKPGAIVTDVGSTKEQIVKSAIYALPAGTYFVGSHPMAGSEKRGPDAARSDLFANALCLICSQPDYKQGVAYSLAADTYTAHEYAAVQRVESFWQSLGMRTLRVLPDLHDRWVAAVSHLPHAAATALMLSAASDPHALVAAANGLIDTTRIAGGDAEMWTDILLTNGPAIADQISQLQKHLETLKTAIETGDEPALRAHLESAKRARDQWLAQRTKSP
jgi:prephenate dehydrogenase